MRIVCVVEGRGDVASVPVMIRRIAEGLQRFDVLVVRPLRVKRSKVVHQGELERAVEQAARKLGGPGAIVVLLDADEDAPCVLGPELLERTRSARGDVPRAVVLAKAEKEAWFLAAAASLRGKRGLPGDLEPPERPEEVRDAKGWLSQRMGRPYSEITDQPAFSALFDMTAARQRCPSFDKFYRDIEGLLTK